MPRQNTGTYSQPAGTAAVSLQTIGSAGFNSLISDLGTEVTNSVDRRGRGAMLAAFNAGGFPVNDIGQPVLPGDAARLGDLTAAIQNSAFSIGALTSGTTPNGLASAQTPVLQGLTSGVKLLVRAGAANTSPTVTFQADTQVVTPLVKGLNQPLALGDISGAGHWLELLYDATFGAWILLNPATGVSNALIGMVAPFAIMAPLDGTWFRCNGQAISRANFPLLFAAAGTAPPFGAGDGSTTFNVPSIGGQFLRALDTSGQTDPNRAIGTYQDDQFQDHTHDWGNTVRGGYTSVGTQGSFVQGGPAGAIFTTAPVTGKHGGETRPKNVAYPYQAAEKGSSSPLTDRDSVCLSRRLICADRTSGRDRCSATWASRGGFGRTIRCASSGC